MHIWECRWHGSIPIRITHWPHLNRSNTGFHYLRYSNGKYLMSCGSSDRHATVDSHFQDTYPVNLSWKWIFHYKIWKATYLGYESIHLYHLYHLYVTLGMCSRYKPLSHNVETCLVVRIHMAISSLDSRAEEVSSLQHISWLSWCKFYFFHVIDTDVHMVTVYTVIWSARSLTPIARSSRKL